MFGFSKQNEEAPMPEWAAQCQETEQRWFTFLDKLEAKMQELCEAAIPELQSMYASDEDPFKRVYHRLMSGIQGQLSQIRKKGADAYDDKVNALYDEIKCHVSVTSPHYKLLSDFRTKCSERYHRQFDKCYQSWDDKLRNTQQEDFEIKYQNILVEFERIKESFTCKQCGGGIVIPKIFFIATVITCPFCQTQNTFEPSTQSRNLEEVGRKLAEQRTQPLMDIYLTEHGKEREIYFAIHELKLKRFGTKAEETDNTNRIAALEVERQQSIKNAPPLYEKYLRAMFDEWNKIVPDLAAQNEKFYLRQLEDFRKRN